MRGVAATGEKDSAIRVSFKAKKTGKTSKFTFAAKVTVVAPEEPTTPEEPVASATKIVSVTPVAADAIEVKFDAPVADSTKEIKLDRAGSAVEVTATWSDQKDSVVLTGKAAFVAGTYNVTFDTFTGIGVVTARKASSIEILTTKVGLDYNLGTDSKVFFNVLDQYGKAMDYSSNRLTVSATNMTRGINMVPLTNSVTKNPYFTVTTNSASMKVGDSVAVVATLTSDPTIVKTATLTIENIYTKEFKFGEVNTGSDAHAYTNQTNKYKLGYTASDVDGNAVTLSKATSLGATKTRNNITFVSSNDATIDPKDFKIDADGTLYFTTKNYPSKVTITAVNNVTGETDSIVINVGESAKATKLDIADITVAKKNYTNTNEIGKALVTVYDQYGDVMKPEEIAKLDLSTSLFDVVAGLGEVTAKISDDGKNLVYTADTAGFDASHSSVGTTYNINFVSKTDATQTSVGKITIGESNSVKTLKETTAPDVITLSDEKVNAKFNIIDAYDGILSATSVGAITGLGKIEVDDNSGILANYTIKGTTNNITTVELQAKTVTTGYETGSYRIVLVNNDNEEIAALSYNLTVSAKANSYEVSRDKDEYDSSDKVKLTVKALNGTAFLTKYKATVPVSIADGTKTYYERLSFVDGVATFEIPAIASDSRQVTITNLDDNTTTGQTKTYKVNASAASLDIKYSATPSAIVVKDNAGNIKSDYKGVKYATFKVVNLTTGLDVTGDFINANSGSAISAGDGNKRKVTFANGFVADVFKANVDLSAGKAYTGGTFVASGLYKVTVTLDDGLSGEATFTQQNPS